jgi:hypothetical protein
MKKRRRRKKDTAKLFSEIMNISEQIGKNSEASDYGLN